MNDFYLVYITGIVQHVFKKKASEKDAAQDQGKYKIKIKPLAHCWTIFLFFIIAAMAITFWLLLQQCLEVHILI